MKKTLKMVLTTCLLLLAVCGASLSVSARTTYFKGLISIDPSFPDSTFDANEQINFPFTVTCYPRACLKIKNCTKHVFLQPFS